MTVQLTNMASNRLCDCAEQSMPRSHLQATLTSPCTKHRAKQGGRNIPKDGTAIFWAMAMWASALITQEPENGVTQLVAV